jgi:hypothetical protein
MVGSGLLKGSDHPPRAQETLAAGQGAARLADDRRGTEAMTHERDAMPSAPTPHPNSTGWIGNRANAVTPYRGRKGAAGVRAEADQHGRQPDPAAMHGDQRPRRIGHRPRVTGHHGIRSHQQARRRNEDDCHRAGDPTQEAHENRGGHRRIPGIRRAARHTPTGPTQRPARMIHACAGIVINTGEDNYVAGPRNGSRTALRGRSSK